MIVKHIILSFIKKNKMRYIIYFILVVFTLIISTILIPIYLSRISNNNINNNFFLSLVFIIVGYVFINYLKSIIQNKLLIDSSSAIKLKVVELIVNNLTTNLNTHTESEITNYSNMIYGGLQIYIKYIFEYLAPYLLINFILLSYFIYNNYFYIFYILLLQFLVILLIIKINFSTHLKLGNNIETEWINTSNILGDKIKNLENIFINNNLQKEIKELKLSQNKLDVAFLNYYEKSNKLDFILNLFSYIFFIVLLYYIIKYRQKTQITLILFIIIIYNTNFTNFIKETIFVFHNLSKIVKLDNYILTTYNITNITGEYERIQKNVKYSKIVFKNVYFRYNEKEKYIIKNLNIEFIPNKINLLLGRSGIGKTTIVKLLIKKYKCSSGKILCNNYDLDTLSYNTVFKNVYYVNQKTLLFNLSIFENIKYGNNSSNKKINYIINKYNLMTVFTGINNNLNYNCGVNGNNLSLGMQKIIIILRGILNNDKNIIIFDEPVTSLDTITSNKIVDLIISETKNKTIIIITHGKEFHKFANHIIEL